MEMKKFNNMPDKNFQKFHKKNVGVLRGAFYGFGCPKDSPTPFWLRLLEATCFCVWSLRQGLIISGAVLCCTARHLDGLIGSGRGC